MASTSLTHSSLVGVLLVELDLLRVTAEEVAVGAVVHLVWPAELH
jgi:hypothetical protein